MSVCIDRRYLVRGTRAYGIALTAVKRMRKGGHVPPHTLTVAGIHLVVIDLPPRHNKGPKNERKDPGQTD